MSSKYKLEGKVGAAALKTLKLVTDILEKNDVNYCLDAGTLLGVVRENRLLPWDTDIDLCITADNIEKLKKSLQPLKSKNLSIRESLNGVEDHNILNPDDLRVVKVRNRVKLIIRGPVLIDIFIKYPDAENYYWSEGAIENRVVKSVPRTFHDNLTTIEFDGKKYPIPEDYDGYLTSRYGDWRVPVKEWNHLTDDQAMSS